MDGAAPEAHVLRCIIHSVFSEACEGELREAELRIECCCTALRFSVFLDLRCTNCHVIAALYTVSLASSTAGRTKLRIVDFDSNNNTTIR